MPPLQLEIYENMNQNIKERSKHRMKKNEEDTGQFIVLDRRSDPRVCTDRRGKTLYFETEDNAHAYGEKHSPSFQVVMLEH
jgi:hypothetical protein